MEPYPTATQVDGKADLVKRFLALLIDGVIAVVISGVFGLFGSLMSGVGLLIAAGYILTRDGLDHELAPKRSIGKKIIGLEPIRLDGMPMTMDVSIKRNITLAAASIVSAVSALLAGLGMSLLAIPIGLLAMVVGLLNLVEGIMVLVDPEGRRLGDKYAGTKVVESAA